MNNITYLLGAGASFNSIPVLKELNKSIIDFLNRLKYLLEKEEILITHIKYNWIPLINLAGEHTSVDTFAKKLYITRDKILLWRLKLILSAYFIYEQSHKEDAYKTYIVQSNPKYSKYAVDSRYDFFMAALLKLKNGYPKLPENLKIVSWNYDSQIEMSFHPYSGIDHNDDKSLRKHLHMFPQIDFEYPKNEEIENDDFQMIKLNGTAGNLYREKTNSYEVQSFRKLFFKDAIEQIKFLVGTSMNKEPHSEYINYGSNINFAWELRDNWFSNVAVETARKIVSESRTLVIIGYSFPVFNREIDKYIFENNTLEKIYIQDLPENISGIHSRACRIIDIDPEICELEPNVDQFIIPFEL